MRRTRLFDEPPKYLDDTWRHGALLGGMASPTGHFEMARAFRRCADTIIDQKGKERSSKPTK